MALNKCGECGKEISSKAPNCPGCGAPVTQPKTRTRIFGFLTTLLIIGGSIFFFSMWVSGRKISVTPTSPRTPPATPQKEIQAQESETSDSTSALTDNTPIAPREFSSPAPTNTPEAPPAPPEDFGGGATAADQANKEQRDKGLVLWKGEWMSPEKRARLRAADDASKHAAFVKPVKSTGNPTTEDVKYIVPMNLKVGQRGLIISPQPELDYYFEIDQVLSDKKVLIREHLGLSARTTPIRFIVEIPTKGLADDARITVSGVMEVVGTEKAGAQTFYLLRPFDK